MPSPRDFLRRNKYRFLLGLGFSSGLPFSLANGTLQAWLAESGLNPATIGLLTLTSLPHTLKFLWAPLIDRFRLPFLGQRRGWMLSAQILQAGLIVWLGLQSPGQAIQPVALLAFALMLVATVFDINYAAYRSDVLQPAEHATGSAYSVMGYRVAILVSGAGAMILSGFIGWKYTYWLMAAIMACCIGFTLGNPEPVGRSIKPKTMREAILPPFRELWSREQSGWLAVFIVIYALGDQMEVTMLPVFAIEGAHFTVAEVGLVTKVMGSAALIAGVAISAFILRRLGLFRTFLLVSGMQILLHLVLLSLSLAGKSYLLFVAGVLISNLAISISSTLWSTWMIGLCAPAWPATQYALISALAGSTRILSGPLSGLLAEHVGWSHFFALNILFDLPGIVLLFCLIKHFRENHYGTVAKN